MFTRITCKAAPLAAAAAVAATVAVAAPASAASAAPAAGRVLPHWVHVYHSRYRAGPHAARCFVIGTATSRLNGIVCANGVAYSAAESNGGRPYPHGLAYSNRSLPAAIRWWGRPHGARAVVIGAGNADSAIMVTRHAIRES